MLFPVSSLCRSYAWISLQARNVLQFLIRISRFLLSLPIQALLAGPVMYSRYMICWTSTPTCTASSRCLYFLWIFYEIRKAKGIVLHVVVVHQPGVFCTGMPAFSPQDPARAKCQTATPPVRIETSPCLHTPSRLKSSQRICWNPIIFCYFAVEQHTTVGITSRQIEQVNPSKDNQETTQ